MVISFYNTIPPSVHVFQFIHVLTNTCHFGVFLRILFVCLFVFVVVVTLMDVRLEVCQLYWSFQRTNFLIYIFYLFFMFSILLIWGFSFIIFLLLLGLLCFSFSRFLRWELSLLIWYFSSFLVCAFSFIKFLVIITLAVAHKF